MLLKHLLKPSTIINWYQSDTSMHLVGPPGCGKTSVSMIDIPRILSEHFGESFGVHEEPTTSLDAVDARGFLVPTKDPKTGEPVSYFTRPGIMPSTAFLEAHPRGIYVLDERSQAQLLTQTALGPTVLHKQFGKFTLPPGWRVISASNRLSDRSAVIRPPMHLINREVTIQVEFDILSSATWWEARGQHPMGTAFAKSHPGIFVSEVPADPVPYCTPRSYTMAWDFLHGVAGVDANGAPNMVFSTDHVVQEFVAGYIGDGSAAELFAFLKVADELPTIEEIKKDPAGCKVPERLDAAYAGLQLCLHHADASNVDKLWTWTERLPIELQTSAASSLLEKSGGQLLNSQALGKWIAKNSALLLETTG